MQHSGYGWLSYWDDDGIMTLMLLMRDGIMLSYFGGLTRRSFWCPRLNLWKIILLSRKRDHFLPTYWA